MIEKFLQASAVTFEGPGDIFDFVVRDLSGADPAHDLGGIARDFLGLDSERHDQFAVRTKNIDHALTVKYIDQIDFVQGKHFFTFGAAGIVFNDVQNMLELMIFHCL